MRIPLFVLLLVFITNTYGQTSLKATINNLPHGKVYLKNTVTNQIDSAEIRNSAFSFNANLQEPTLFDIIFKGYNDRRHPIKLILSNKTTSLIFRELKAVKQDGTWRNLYPNKPVFQNDPNSNQVLFDFETSYQIFYDSIIKMDPTPGSTDSLLPIRKNLVEGFIRDMETVVKSNSNKVVSAVILFDYVIINRLIDIHKIKDLFLELDDQVRYSTAGVKIGTHINRELSIAIGKVAPAFEFVDMSGTKHCLTEFKDKIVLLHFWSSTCGPCRVENKKIVNLSKNYNKITIINISLDMNKKQWKNAIIKDGLTEMINTADSEGHSKVVQDYYLHGIPAYFLIDEKGLIVSKGSLTDITSSLNNQR